MKEKVVLTPEQKQEIALLKKQNLQIAVKQGLPALGILAAITAVLFCFYVFVIGLGGNMSDKIVTVTQHYNQHVQVSNPSVLRLIYMFVSVAGGIALLVLASKKQENKFLGLILGFTAGLLIWQGVGECSWQFGLWEGVPDNRVFVNFAYLKGIQGTFPLILCVLGCLYMNKKDILPWFLQIALLTFIGIWAVNWAVIALGALWPIGLKYHNPYHWPAIIGILVGLHGALTVILQLFVLKKVKTPEGVWVRIIVFLLLAGLCAVGFGVKAPVGL